MRRIQVGLKSTVDNSYEIVIERGLLKKMASDLRMRRWAEKYVVITDSRVGRLYASKVVDALKREDLYLGKITVPAGEESKSMGQFKECLEKMVDLGANRKTGVIALGGGVVGDLSGYVAASFMRGIDYVHVPTTLLAMVDSSIGGKVGIDLDAGKNLAGAFWQPKKVYIDPDVLVTLSQKHWKAGLGEALKYGAIKDRKLWDFFESHVDLWNKKPSDFLPSEWKTVEEMIERCAQIKVDVVMKDEKEGNLRMILNYGHTFAHVIELMSGYKVLHGEAVATGMRMAASLALHLRHMPQAEIDKQNALLDQLKLGKAKTKGLIKDFIKHMKKDKKAKGDIRVILVSRLGTCYQQLGKYGIKVEAKDLKAVLQESGLIDDKEVAPEPVASTYSYSSPSSSYSSSSYSSSSSTSSSSMSFSSSEQPEETDLQRRLREMRERAEMRRQMRNQENNNGGLGSGGFLP